MRASPCHGTRLRLATSLLLAAILAAASIAVLASAATAVSPAAAEAAKKKRCKKGFVKKRGKCRRKRPAGTTTPVVTAPGTTTGTVQRGPTTLSISPTSHDFGTVPPEEHSDPQSFVVTNTGPNPASPISFTTDGENADEFHVHHDLCSGRTLLPGGTCTLEAVFVSGLAPGPKSGVLRINGPFAAPVSASLSAFTGPGLPEPP